MLDVANEGAAKKRGHDVAEGAPDGSPEQTAREAWAELGGVVGGGSKAAGVNKDLAEGDEKGESKSEAQAEGRVKPCGKARSTDSAEECFPRKRVVRKAASGTVEFDGQGEPAGEAGGDSEEETQAEAVTDSEDHGVSDRAGQHAERAVLSAEEIVGEVEAAENVQRSADDGDRGDDVMIEVMGHANAEL